MQIKGCQMSLHTTNSKVPHRIQKIRVSTKGGLLAGIECARNYEHGTIITFGNCILRLKPDSDSLPEKWGRYNKLVSRVKRGYRSIAAIELFPKAIK